MKRLLLLLALLTMTVGAGAQGFIVADRIDPRDRIRRPIPSPFYVKNLRISTLIRDAVAETTVEQTFVNDSSVEQEGTYLFPLPEGATPTAFTMTVGERTMEPRVLTKDEARNIYESIVRSRRDPALLEYVGRNLVRISVYPIPARGERLIRMRYTEVLRPENNLRKYACALSTARFGSRPVGTVSVEVKVQTSALLKNVYSPTHNVLTRRPDDRTATVSWEGVNDLSDQDLVLYYSTNGEEVGLSLLTYQTGDRDGYFMLLAAPRVQQEKQKAVSKSVVFVLDRTGSMAGEKIKQAKKALLYCLDTLRSIDRFNVITFSDSADPLMRRMEPATEANIRKAREYVQSVEASGGTNIDEGLRAGLAMIREEPGTQKMLVFMTDGLPTLGETNVETILKHVEQWNGSPNLARRGGPNAEAGANARIFSFGLGYDVNVPFLDKLSDQGRGEADYVKPQEDIEVKVSSFFGKVASPILANLKLAFDGMDVYDIYPKAFPDLFKGSQLVITGRYRGVGVGTVKLTGMAGNTPESFAARGDFREFERRNAFLPRIWATRKIGWLIDQIRLSNNPEAKKEVLDEIVRLSRDYGIITEYTSFLVDEREQMRLGLNSPTDALDAEKLSELRKEVAQRARQFGVQGEATTNQSLRAKDLALADKAASRYQSANGSVFYSEAQAGGVPGKAGQPGQAAPGNFGGGGFGGGLSGEALAQRGAKGRSNANALSGPANDSRNAVSVQSVAGRAFYRQKNNVWQDHSYADKKQKLVAVQAFSEAHFALLRALPEMASYSSVGEEVIVRLGRNAVQIGKSGKERLTAAELRELVAR